jgi:hypothetical protein
MGADDDALGHHHSFTADGEREQDARTERDRGRLPAT